METSGPALTINPLSGALGAEITGIDLARLDDPTFDAIHAAFLDHQVLVFRGQHLSAAEYTALARRFGEPAEYPFAKGLEGHPEITMIVKEAHQVSNFGGIWHTDTTYRPKPPKATMLMALETPPSGGDTLFACQYQAYEALPEAMKQRLAGLHGVSSSAKNASALRATHLATGSMRAAENAARTLTATHPAVRRHPETGRLALYLNRSHTVRFAELTPEESAPLLDQLFDHQTRPEFTARIRWRPGTVVIWDNRSCQHRAINDYDGHRREMWRITLEGETPRGP
ncbi:MAG: TauD/TfdA family dioxygenase [Proteobacteria bacterium]|nr:TauD/TfdA family dioxygenase [Pseudomonadota bacterium]